MLPLSLRGVTSSSDSDLDEVSHRPPVLALRFALKPSFVPRRHVDDLRHHPPAPRAVLGLVHRGDVPAGVGQLDVGRTARLVPRGPQLAALRYVIGYVAEEPEGGAGGGGDAALRVIDL